MVFNTIEDAHLAIDRIIRIYNRFRLHSSLEMKTPCFAHVKPCVLKRKWKNYYFYFPKLIFTCNICQYPPVVVGVLFEYAPGKDQPLSV